VEIGTNSKVPTSPFVIQPIVITKPISPLRGGIHLEIIPLLVQTFSMLVQVAIITHESMKGNEKSAKEHAEPINCIR
jgi:hypothetical protein